MLLAINEDSLKKLHCVISAYGEMWKDVEKERYDEYTD